MTRFFNFLLAVGFCAMLSACGGGSGSPVVTVPPASNQPVWSQWGSNPQHTGMVALAGQSLTNKHADIVYDPFVDQEKAENAPLFGAGVLTVHQQAPITDGNDVYMLMKMGSYTSCNPVGDWIHGTLCGPNTWNTMDWCEVRFTWINGQLTQIWSFDSDWKPEPSGGGLFGWEPVFHPVEANNFIYVPGAGGTLWKVDKNTGKSVSHVDPLSGVGGVIAANTYVSGPLTADSTGNVYYNVVQLADPSQGDPWFQNDVVNAWLVKITATDSTSTVSYASLVPAAPPGNATTCPGTFFGIDGAASLPWPPANVVGTNQVAPPQICGSQRPGINLAPAIAPDGTIYTASRAHFDPAQAYLVSVNPQTLAPNWAASLQRRLTDGCGVILPIAPAGNTTTPNSCRNGATVGVDPTTNDLGSGQIADLASSSPTVLPDGSVLFGALDNYNFSRGHMLHFDAAGNFLNSYPFGWDETPAVYTHGATYSLVLKDNHYDATAYCGFQGNVVCTAAPKGPYYITQLDASLNIEWQFQNTTTDATHPNGYEWCINMPAIDMNGNVFVNSEDGNIYELPQGQTGIFTQPTGKLFLDLALGAAYTPLSIGLDGKLYTQNNGHLIVVGN